MKWRAGDWVEVKSKDEILTTLDKDGRFEEMPFMPQMFQYCGKQFQVYRRAHKTCDTVFPVRGRRVKNAVHLDIRCDGVAYGGCQAGCLIFWKTAWLRRVDTKAEALQEVSLKQILPNGAIRSTTEADVMTGICLPTKGNDDGVRYICQATQLPYFTSPLHWWDVRQYFEDIASRNIMLRELVKGFLFAGYQSVLRAGIGVGPVLTWLYDKMQAVLGGASWPRKAGTVQVGQPTPRGIPMYLKAGDLVRVKSHEEILDTLDTHHSNRGLYFDAEAVPFCGNTYRVRNRVDKFIDEKTGKLVTLKSDAVILEDVWCKAKYSHCRMFCPRSIYQWWRDIWLEKLPEVLPHSPRQS